MFRSKINNVFDFPQLLPICSFVFHDMWWKIVLRAKILGRKVDCSSNWSGMFIWLKWSPAGMEESSSVADLMGRCSAVVAIENHINVAQWLSPATLLQACGLRCIWCQQLQQQQQEIAVVAIENHINVASLLHACGLSKNISYNNNNKISSCSNWKPHKWLSPAPLLQASGLSRNNT